jgi:late competence protein required for DNA uptake (superfamily II DNA/RNA helicase)
VCGLPTKDGKEYPLFDYEKLLYDSLINYEDSSPFKNKHLWVKKATGLGVTEFMLRIIAWLCTKDGHFANAQICIVTGPNQDIAIKLIKRLKGIFD